VKDYTTFINEINILRQLVSKNVNLTLFRTTRTLSSFTKSGNGMKSAS